MHPDNEQLKQLARDYADSATYNLTGAVRYVVRDTLQCEMEYLFTNNLEYYKQIKRSMEGEP